MGDNLKACPFCGATVPYMESAYEDRMHGEAVVYNVQCQQCCASGPAQDSYYKAAEAWGDVSAMRARAEAAEQRATAAEADVAAWRDALLARVRERYDIIDLHTDYPGASRLPERRLWRVVSHRGVVGVGATEVEALLQALDALASATARAEAAEARVAEAEAAGYRRAVDDACAVLDARYDKIAERGTEGPYDDGKLIALDLAERAVRKLAPVEPSGNADELAAAKGGA